MNKSNGPLNNENRTWTMIEAISSKNGLIENALVACVKREMGIVIEKVNFVSECCYHAQLSDDNVNNIDRAEGQLLDFFTVKEMDNLTLSTATSSFISKHRSLI